MPKKIKVKYDDKLTLTNLYNAFYRAKKGKIDKKEIIKFEQNLESNLISIYDELLNLTYIPSKYREFTIYEPKERLIQALPIKDRVIHQWYVEEFLKPYMVPKFINDTYACIIGRGTHKSYQKIKHYMRCMRKIYGDYYIIKLDIKKYFFSIDRETLYNILEKNFKDKKFLKLTKAIIGDFNEKGIPIGNYTSQYFANIYLNELDHYIKFDLRIKYYCRYMDDFVILVKNKETAKEVFRKIEKFLIETLKLELNKKSKYYSSKKGCDFCGYIIHEDYVLLRKRNKNNLKRKVKTWCKLYSSKKLDITKFKQSYVSFLGYSRHADSYKFINNIQTQIKDIIKTF